MSPDQGMLIRGEIYQLKNSTILVFTGNLTVKNSTRRENVMVEFLWISAQIYTLVIQYVQ